MSVMASETDAACSVDDNLNSDKDDADGAGSWVRLPIRVAPTTEDNDSRYVYKMDHPRRGYCVIINNEIFEQRTSLANRKGADVDTNNIQQAFEKLGFEVLIYTNLTYRDILHRMTEAAQYDHSDVDCFACVIMSHGTEDGVYSTDGYQLNIDILARPFKGTNCSTLTGKPKLFFIQASRGGKLDPGVDVTDSDEVDGGRRQIIPEEADFLHVYSTVLGFYSWRNPAKGSCFIASLSRILEEHGDMEITRILTRVNHRVAFEFESNVSSDASKHQKKQIPSIVSRLTKDLYFHPSNLD